MANRIREYHRPKDIEEAIALWRQDEKPKLLMISPKPTSSSLAAEKIIDLSLLGFSFIRSDENAIHIGAMTPVQDLVESPVIQAVADGILSEAAQLTAHLGLRNLANLEGVMYSPECPPEIRLILQVLQMDFLPMTTDAQLAYGVIIPRRPDLHGALVRVARAPRDEAVVAASAVVKAHDGICQEVRLAVSCPEPKGVFSVEDILKDKPFRPNLLHLAVEATKKEVDAQSDFRASAEYRREMAGVLAKRALEMAWKRATQ